MAMAAGLGGGSFGLPGLNGSGGDGGDGGNGAPGGVLYGNGGALVRIPRSVEALGRVDMVCFDKTGTLSENRLRVALRCRWSASRARWRRSAVSTWSASTRPERSARTVCGWRFARDWLSEDLCAVACRCSIAGSGRGGVLLLSCGGRADLHATGCPRTSARLPVGAALLEVGGGGYFCSAVSGLRTLPMVIGPADRLDRDGCPGSAGRAATRSSRSRGQVCARCRW